jgi:phosphoglycerol transferase MdoB-like AlkP superfamily enzyme
MKEKLPAILNRYLILTLSFLPAVMILRLQEFLYLQFLHVVPANTWKYELAGYLMDNLIFLTLAFILLVPFILLSLLHKRAGTILAFTAFTGVALAGFLLVKYFTITLVPLDQVIFTYTKDEIVQIVLSSTRLDLWAVAAFLSVMGLPLVCWHFLRHRKFPTDAVYLMIIVFLLSPVAAKKLMPDQSGYENDFEYFLVNNKVYYAFSRITASRFGGGADKSFAGIRTLARNYHKQNREFQYLDPYYPFLRTDDSKDVLGGYFNFGNDKPNLVFIVVESLSPSFCGENPFYGSFMPFLDSLIRKSLYWDNFVSTSERTFNVLSALFGSLPYSNAVFYNSAGAVPPHFSMIRYLKDQGYHPYFFYGGDPAFSGYSKFMEMEGTEYILRSFPNENKKHLIRENTFEWGYPDGIMFQRALEVVDSLKETPRLEVYLTLSMHEPFTPPDADYYRKMLGDRINELGLSGELRKMVTRQRNIFATILYSDGALREFFSSYSKRPDFSNTVFFITGDHAMPEVNMTYSSQIERYHIPFIIYSPMLKSTATFHAVSSHLDVTPSVLAMMQHNFGIRIRPFCHWLGSGIDVSPGFRNTHSLSMIFNNREQSEYLRKNYFIAGNRLYKVLPGLKLLPMADTAILNPIMRERDVYIDLTTYVAERSALVPPDLFYGRYYQQVDIKQAWPVKYTNLRTSDVYVSLLRGQKIGEDFKVIRAELELTLRSENPDTAQFPQAVVQIFNSKGGSEAWWSYRLKPLPAGPRKNRYALQQNIDLANVEDPATKSIKIYLWNKKLDRLQVDDLKISLKGFKISEK